MNFEPCKDVNWTSLVTSWLPCASLLAWNYGLADLMSVASKLTVGAQWLVNVYDLKRPWAPVGSQWEQCPPVQLRCEAPSCYLSADELVCMHLITPPVNQRTSGWSSGLLSAGFDWIVLCMVIMMFYCHGRLLQWFGQDSSTTWLSGNNSQSPLTFNTSPPSSPPALSAQTNKYLLPRWWLLTASKPENSPTAHSCRTRWCFPLTGGMLHSHYHSQSSVSTGPSSRAPSSIRGASGDTIATQSTAWQLDRLSQATSHILSQSRSDKTGRGGSSNSEIAPLSAFEIRSNIFSNRLC